jgi:hypothetical protein
MIVTMQHKPALDWLDRNIEKATLSFHHYMKENWGLFIALAIVAFAAYGFELFNLNITIDEEIHATFIGHTRLWLQQGRWGMYLLNKFIFPYTIIPFMPLFVALVFNILAMVLLFMSWGGKSKTVQFLIGSLGIVFPTIAYMYTFSTINYGIGIGLFLASLSTFIYSRLNKLYRYLAVIPAAFSLAIYQGFLPVLLAIFLIYHIAVGFRTGKIYLRDLFYIATILATSFLLYYIGQILLVRILNIPPDSYVARYFDTAYLLNNFSVVITRLSSLMRSIYLGDKSFFAINMPIIGIMIAIALISFALNLWKADLSISIKFILALFTFSLIILPFLSGLLNRGYLSMRFLLALPITISAIIMFGMSNKSKVMRTTLFFLTCWCIFQSATATNRLFASSHLALQADRLFASRLIVRIEDALNESGNLKKLKYLEMVGSYNRRPTMLIPIAETFGASFFSWGDGDPSRVVAFLDTIGYQNLQPLPVEGRIQMVKIAEGMPIWPAQGSVKIVGDTVLIKFGPYSSFQKSIICRGVNNTNELLDFCP